MFTALSAEDCRKQCEDKGLDMCKAAKFKITPLFGGQKVCTHYKNFEGLDGYDFETTYVCEDRGRLLAQLVAQL